MNSLDVSVVIPVRNGVDYIASALNSVFNQTIQPAAVVVVDDGSTDGTRELILRDFGERVTILTGPQAGAGPARNVGVQHCGTALIAFLDADDEWHPTKLEKQLEVYEPRTILGTYSHFFVSTARGRRFFGTSIRTKTDFEANSMIESGSALPTLLSTWLFEKQAFIEVGAFDESYVFAQDFELAMRFSLQGYKFQILREVLVDYRIHQTSETYTNYVSQRMFAAFSKYKHAESGNLLLEEWAKKFWSHNQTRNARAGFYFRLGLGHLGTFVPLRAFGYFFISAILDPAGFAVKVKKQADLRLLFQRVAS